LESFARAIVAQVVENTEKVITQKNGHIFPVYGNKCQGEGIVEDGKS